VFADVNGVTVTDPMTGRSPPASMVRPAFLWSTGRHGMACPEQIKERRTAPSNLIGTGPFKKKDDANAQVRGGQ